MIIFNINLTRSIIFMRMIDSFVETEYVVGRRRKLGENFKLINIRDPI